MLSSSKRSEISAFLAMDVMRQAQTLSQDGADICHMEVGQPGTPAPKLVRERAKAALDNAKLGYTEALGMSELRSRIAQHYDESYGVSVSPTQIIITTGSSAGFILAFLAVLDVGDQVGIMRPGYPCYREILSTLGVRPVDVELDFNNGWVPSVDQITNHIERDQIKALLLASPANPTGVMLGECELQAMLQETAKRKVWFFSDEIYHGLTYERPAVTAAGSGDHVIVLNSFSKYYSMTGWRIGWMVVPGHLVRTIEKLNQHLFISAPALSQIAAIAAFDAIDELEHYKAQYQRNREILMEGLQAAGFGRFAPADGAFYIYTDVSDYTNDSLDFSAKLLKQYGIAASPGVDFDRVGGHTMMRFSYAGSEAEIIKAVERLKGAKF